MIHLYIETSAPKIAQWYPATPNHRVLSGICFFEKRTSPSAPSLHTGKAIGVRTFPALKTRKPHLRGNMIGAD